MICSARSTHRRTADAPDDAHAGNRKGAVQAESHDRHGGQHVPRHLEEAPCMKRQAIIEREQRQSTTGKQKQKVVGGPNQSTTATYVRQYANTPCMFVCMIRETGGATQATHWLWNSKGQNISKAPQTATVTCLVRMYSHSRRMRPRTPYQVGDSTPGREKATRENKDDRDLWCPTQFPPSSS